MLHSSSSSVVFIKLLRSVATNKQTNKTPSSISTTTLIHSPSTRSVSQNKPTNQPTNPRQTHLLLYLLCRKKMPSQQHQGQQQQQATTMGPTRWCPTPEQLMILEEMYRGGLRTPNASQIQQITAHLASYGRIEGKNVFYWFQNHKARDRQKLRRRLCMSHHLLTCAHQYHHYYSQSHSHHGGGGFLAPPPVTMPVAPYASVFDQSTTTVAGQLLTSPTPAAAAAAAAYGYYYPAATAALAAAAPPPATRCTPPSPNQLFNINTYHQHQGGSGRGTDAPADHQAALGRPAEYSLGKLDNFGVVDAAVDDTVAGPPGFEPSFCRPLKTLDLFPGGIKEEQHDVA